ncbi:mucin-13 isoform X3 [Rhinatrema bivittatum]|uniref:mucin-13 isoform X3 n=1 Tax=Rhinatrema bivittatum TaxID=194408 RepID=UPI001126BA6A|nr:mucin-13 isoform X3 [Rhinatrema bivittatum]
MRGSILLIVLCDLVFSNLQGSNTTVTNTTMPTTNPTTTQELTTSATIISTTPSITPELTTSATIISTTPSITPELTTSATIISTTPSITPVSTTTATSIKMTTTGSSNTVTNTTTPVMITSPGSNNTVTNTTTSVTSPESNNPMTSMTTPVMITSPDANNPMTNTTTPVMITSTERPKPCEANPCRSGIATCINMQTNHTCKCPFGFFYNDSEGSCDLGKSFYGQLTLDVPFKSDMMNTESPEYQAVYKNITEFFAECFVLMNNDFGQTLINEITVVTQASRAWKAANSGQTLVKVLNVFRLNSSVTGANVTAAIMVILNSSTYYFTYSSSDICKDNLYCDNATTDCSITTGAFPNCTCKTGYYTIPSVQTTCRACHPDCGAANSNAYCHIPGGPVCKCKPNYENTTGKCEPCAVGYSGEDCKDNVLLIVIIVAAVLGAVMLALIGAVIGISVKSNRSKSDRRQLISNEEPLDLANPGGPFLFPKVQARSGWVENKPSSNPYEREERYTSPEPERDYNNEDPWYEMSNKSRPQSRF